MERRGNVDNITGNAGRVILFCCGSNLSRESGKQTQQSLLAGVSQQAGIQGIGTLKGHTGGFQLFQHGADAGVGVLDIVDRIFAVVAHSQVKVEIQSGGAFALVEEETCGINGHFVQQVGQGDGLAGTLAHTHRFAVAHQVDHLHQHNIQLGAVQANGVHGTLHAGYMAVMVGTPNVDGTVKTAHGQLVVMVGDVGGKIGGNAVGAYQNFVFGFLFAVGVFVLLAVYNAVLGSVLGAAVHDGTVLGLVAGTLVHQDFDDIIHSAALVQVAFVEPDIIGDAVLAQVALQPGNVLGQGIGNQGIFQLFKVLIEIGIAVNFGKLFGASDNVSALVAFFRQGNGFFAFVQLQVADGQALAELLDLVACIVDVELAGHIITGPVQAGSQAVAQSTAAGVAHVHGAGGVGGNKFNVVALACTAVRAAVFRLSGSSLQHAGKPVGTQEQVDEAGACDLYTVEQAALQVQVVHNGLCNLARSLVERTGTGHGGVGCNIAVFDIGGNLNNKFRQRGFRKGTVRHSSIQRAGQQLTRRIQRSLAGVIVFVIHVVPPVWKLGGRS